jgi:hypothetical protein
VGKLYHSAIGNETQCKLSDVVSGSSRNLDAENYLDLANYELVQEYCNCNISSDDSCVNYLSEFNDLVKKTNFNLNASKKNDNILYQKMVEFAYYSGRSGIYVGEC